MADMKTKAAPQSDNANSISADGAKIATTLGAAVTLLGGAAFGFSRLEPAVSAAAVNALAETRQISPEGRAVESI